MSNFLNKKGVKAYALMSADKRFVYAGSLYPSGKKFTKVSDEFVTRAENALSNHIEKWIDDEIMSMPSKGKTIK